MALTDKLTAIADAIRAKAGTTDGMRLDQMPDLIASIEAGSGEGTGVEPIKAFDTQPNTNEIQVKNIAPVIKPELIASAYTNTEATIGVTFGRGYGTKGHTYILALAIRNPSAEPTLPDGWEKCAWVEPHADSTSGQHLYVAKHTVTDDVEGTTCTITFDVTQGERHYLMVASVGDSEISTNDAKTYVDYGKATISPEVHENTILICSSETTFQNGSDISSDAWILHSGYSEKHLPNYDDGFIKGGRLAMVYIPYLGEQPFIKPTIYIKRDATGETGSTTGIICVALKLIPGTISRYEAVLDAEEITAAQALSIITGGDS